MDSQGASLMEPRLATAALWTAVDAASAACWAEARIRDPQAANRERLLAVLLGDAMVAGTLGVVGAVLCVVAAVALLLVRRRRRKVKLSEPTESTRSVPEQRTRMRISIQYCAA